MVEKRALEEILLVSNSSEELADIQYILDADFPHLTTALGEELGIEKFSELQPAVLVLGFREIEQAEEFYLMLHSKYPQAGDQLHQTLLLCTSRETRKAYQLCAAGIFDDYLVDRPLNDPQKIRLSLEQILTKREVERELSALHRQNREVSRGVSALDREHQKQLVAVVAHHTQCHQQFDEMRVELQRYLQQHADEKLERAVEAVERAVSQVADELSAIEGSYSNHLQSLQHQPDATTILLVDDDDFYREEIAGMLERSGYNILEVDSGVAALNQLKKTRPNLILLDYMMPGMNGLETLKKIHQTRSFRDIPVIMLTGYSNTKIHWCPNVEEVKLT